MKVSDTQRFAIAKRAAQFGTTAAMIYFASKYPDQFASLKEPTVRRWKNKYKEGLACNKSVGKDESQELCLSKTGRPLKLGEELDKQVREYVQDFQRRASLSTLLWLELVLRVCSCTKMPTC